MCVLRGTILQLAVFHGSLVLILVIQPYELLLPGVMPLCCHMANHEVGVNSHASFLNRAWLCALEYLLLHSSVSSGYFLGVLIVFSF